MIRISSTVQLVDSLRLSRETGTEKQFVECILFLNEWCGEHTTVVDICADFPMSPGSIIWRAYRVKDGKSGDSFYCGGINFSELSNKWSINS